MTLFAALNEINRTDVKIVTAEDPVEYTLPGIIQVQVHKEIDLTFASALRCFLRQDPDVILVGEIRDRETAEIATEAALTGHLLFSTLHTNDASSAVTRLSEMEIEPFVLSSTLVCVCAQRLVRKLCSCKVEAELSPEEKALVARGKDGSEVGKVYTIGHCETCGQAGYKGRTGVHELMVVNEGMRHLIATGSTSEQIKTTAREGGMRTLFEDAMEKVKLGITSLNEALANVSSNESAG
jgi:type IV pilus assembly protein PilB